MRVVVEQTPQPEQSGKPYAAAGGGGEGGGGEGEGGGGEGEGGGGEGGGPKQVETEPETPVGVVGQEQTVAPQLAQA